MKILAVDTSSIEAAVAITDNNRLLAEYIINYDKTHSQKLMPMINEVISALGLTPREIDMYAASSGPGSFTGLRIGVTTVKSMAYAAQKPVISVPTLDALAYNIPVTDNIVCPVMDARNKQVYTALYKFENGLQRKLTENLGVTIDELIEIIKGKNSKVIFVGNAVLLYHDYFKSILGSNCDFAPGHLLNHRASSVAYIAHIKALQGEIESCFDMSPFYLRKSQAEREYEKKQKVIEDIHMAQAGE